MEKSILIGVILVTLVARPAHGDNGVGILSDYDQIITSSTLKWITGTGDIKQLQNAVLGGLELIDASANSANSEDVQSKSVYVCRARHNGVWISGQLRSKYRECVVSLHGAVHTYPKYEILQNLEGGAMLSWMPWDKFTPTVPKGAVAGGQDTYLTYVGRKKVAQDDGDVKDSIGYTHFIGKFDPKEGLGKISFVDDRDKEIESDKGEILVETEPIRYELTSIKLDRWRIRAVRVPKLLAETILRNGAASEAINVDSALAYNYTYQLSWGHGHAILTGLNTTVRLSNGTVLDNYKWGIEINEAREDIFKVERSLEPGTACNVTLSGNYTELDVPYTATLMAYYPDGASKSRLIRANKLELAMLDVTPDYGPVYYLRNNSLVPTTTTTTTTTTSTSTTTTTTEAPVPDIPENVIQTNKIDGVSLTPTKIQTEHNMLSDQSAEKKEDKIVQAGVTGSSSVGLRPSGAGAGAALLSLVTTLALSQRLIM